MTVDPIFSDPRLAAIYDEVDGRRDDLEAYVGLVEELGARTVVDVGCGTGSLALLLAGRGVEVVGIDPAAASLAVARAKPGADRVTWIHGSAEAIPSALRCDLALMTGNVAQVFTTDEAWGSALAAIRAVVRPGGHLAFEVRRPEARAWESWHGLTQRTEHVECHCEVVAVAEPLVTFRWTFRLSGEVLTSTSTLRFRTRREVELTLDEAGFVVRDVRDAPDRPGLEMVFVCARPG